VVGVHCLIDRLGNSDPVLFFLNLLRNENCSMHCISKVKGSHDTKFGQNCYWLFFVEGVVDIVLA
jgi:hypothetical protein